ncbi:hypothetical protein RCO48_29745 [Peribacillus frigoritolerans]|nr:hypothetical protein [Peribacillus frigoritolerans]
MESNGIIDIEFWRLCAAYVFVVILLIIVKWRGITREKANHARYGADDCPTHSRRICFDIYL